MSESPATSKQIRNLDDIVASSVERFRREANPDHNGYQRLFKRRGELDDAVVALLARLAAEQPDYTLARSILGGDFITAEEIMVARPDVAYSPEQIAQLAATMPREAILALLKGYGYGFMPQPPKALSLLDIRSAKPAHFYSKTEGWYANQAFARDDMTGTGWLAAKKTPVNGSTNKNWNEQKALLSSAEYVPNAAEASWFITVFYDVRGVRLFENVYVRTSSLDSDGDRVDVGVFDTRGLNINSYWDYLCNGDLGLASARKF